MVEILGANIPVSMPSFNTGALGTTFIIFASLFIILSFAFVIGIIIYFKKSYNKKIVVFENISGLGYQPVYKDTAKLVKLGEGGEELLYLRKKKVFRTAYGRKMGTNTYWFAVGQDGYWYNIVLGDLDAKMGMLDVEPIDRDMRYMHVAVGRNIRERYRKITWGEKYGPLLAIGIFALIMMGGSWFNIHEMTKTSEKITEGVSLSNKLAEKQSGILASLDNVCSLGTGLQPAPKPISTTGG